MPVAKYFVSVGSALAALLLIVSWYCPAPPAIFTDRPQIITTAAIRIKSERKWPEKIEFDTSQPMIVPPAGEALSVAAQPASLPPEEATAKSPLEALARLPPDTRLTATQRQAVQAKRRLARANRHAPTQEPKMKRLRKFSPNLQRFVQAPLAPGVDSRLKLPPPLYSTEPTQ